MPAKKKLAVLFSILAVGLPTLSASAIEVVELAGLAQGYPGLYDVNGKKLADGEFKQWVEDHRLNVVISYKFPNGQFFEEKTRFRQGCELIQEQWSWKELMHGKSQREFTADFVSGTATAHIRKDSKDVSDKIEIDTGRTFPGFGFTIALSNLRKRLLKGEQIELKAVGGKAQWCCPLTHLSALICCRGSRADPQSPRKNNREVHQ
jgi:hypothetical protein